MISVKELLEHGYKYYQDKKSDNTNESLAYKGLYQKDIVDGNGVKYFISIRHYNFGELGKKLGQSSLRDEDKFEIELNSDTVNDDHVSITLHSRTNHTLDYVEEWCEKTWSKLEGIHYESRN